MVVLLGVATSQALPFVTTTGPTHWNQSEINSSDASNKLGEFSDRILFDVTKYDNEYEIEAYYMGPETHQLTLFVDGEKVSNPCYVARTSVDRVITVKAIVSYDNMVPLEAEKQITIFKLNVQLVDEIDLTFTSLSSNPSSPYLFDNNSDTRWSVTYAGGMWAKTIVDFRSDKPFIPMGYVMTTADDASHYPNHNPKAWQIYAKANWEDEEWKPIVTVTDGTAAGLGTESRTNYNFIIEGLNKEYQFFRFEVDDVCGTDGDKYTFTCKLAGLRLCGKAKTAVTGDVNGDDVVSGADVTALYNVLLDNATAAGDADVNGDSVVSGADVTALYNLLLQ